MKRLEIEIDDDTMTAVQMLARSTNRSVEHLLAQILREMANSVQPNGIFRADAALIDEIVLETMHDREKAQLRTEVMVQEEELEP